MHMRLRPVEDVVKEMHVAEAYQYGKKEGELNKAKQVAKNLLALNQNIDLIVDVTGLSEKVILSLKDSRVD
jgi:hypothetical protein